MVSKRLAITLNGKPRELPAGATAADLVAEFELTPGRFAVEINKSIVPRSQLAQRLLETGDQVEIIGFVGGG